jgi:non-reducing end alpha-L-arabinofuranosidase
MGKMKKNYSILVVSVAVSLGAGSLACASFGGGSPGTGGSGQTGGATGSGGSGTGGSTGSGGGFPTFDGSIIEGATPCEILATAGNSCVAAHSTTRVIYPGYSGPLYQVCKGTSVPGPNSCSSGMTMDIGSVGGYADAASQDTFCTGGTCTISIIYDQSPMKNDLMPAPSGGAKPTADSPVVATALKTTLNGHEVYGVYVKPGMGYRAGCDSCGVTKANGTATGDQAETIYMVNTNAGLIDSCCFDYGNAETDSHDDGNGTMEAVYLGGGVVWGTGSPGGHANGPWVMADLENGIYAGWENNQDQNISTNTRMTNNFITGVLVGDSCTGQTGCAGSGSAYPSGRFALYGGDAQSGPLTTMWDGTRPAKTGYVPMHKQGSIILGTGGDNSASDGGQWFEGAMASGAASLQAVYSLQANIVAAGYGK